MKQPNKHSLTFELPDEAFERLRLMAFHSRCSVGEQVRRLLNASLQTMAESESDGVVVRRRLVKTAAD